MFLILTMKDEKPMVGMRKWELAEGGVTRARCGRLSGTVAGSSAGTV
jgi:hypothetical protein